MKFTVPKATFLDAVAQAAGVLDKNPTGPIMGCVHVVANRAGIHVRGVSTASDLTITVPKDPDGFGGASFDAKVLLAALKSASAETVTMETVKAGKVKVTVGGATHNLNVMDPESAPTLSASESTVTMTFAAKDIERAMKIVKPVIPAESMKYGIPGVALEVGEKVRLFTTDGNRMVYADTTPASVTGKAPSDILVPKDAVESIASLCEGCGDAVVTMSFGKRAASVTLDYVQFVFRLAEGAAPDYRQVVNRVARTITSTVSRDDIASAIKAVIPTARGATAELAWSWSESSVRIETGVSDNGGSEYTADCKTEGGPLRIGLAGKPLLDALAHAGAAVTFEFGGELSPVFVSDGTDWLYLQAPLRL